MSLRAKPFIFGMPVLVALGTLVLLWALFGSSSGSTGSVAGFTWNVELTQRDALGNILYTEKLHNTLSTSGLDAAMERLISSSAVGAITGATDTYDQIVLLGSAVSLNSVINASDILLLVDGSGDGAGLTRTNPEEGTFAGGSPDDGAGDIAVTFLADGDPNTALQMNLVKAKVRDLDASSPELIPVDEILAQITISVDLADTDTLTVTWTIDADATP